MGTMSQEMQKVMSRWNDEKPATPVEQPTIRSQIYDLICQNPGMTSPKVLSVLLDRGMKQTYSAVSSQLTVMYQEFMLRREAIEADPVAGTRPVGRPVFAYYAVPKEETARLKAKRRQRKQLAKARAAKRAKQYTQPEAAPTATTQIQQMPLPFDAPPVAVAAPAPTLSLQSMTAIEILNNISFAQAKDLYKELSTAFGG